MPKKKSKIKNRADGKYRRISGKKLKPKKKQR